MDVMHAAVGRGGACGAGGAACARERGPGAAATGGGFAGCRDVVAVVSADITFATQPPACC